MVHPRSPMSLVNVAYRDALTWGNQDLRSLEQQALVPMLGTAPIELGLAGHEDRVYRTLAARPRLPASLCGGVSRREHSGHDAQRRRGTVGVRTIDRVVPVAVRPLP